MRDIPADLAAMMGRPLFPQVSEGPVEIGAIRLFAAAVQDDRPCYWSEDTGRVIAPPALLSAWNRPLAWTPDGEGRPDLPSGLALHFIVKDRLELPRAVVTQSETELSSPVRPGMFVRSEQTLLAISEPRSSRLGHGRYWTIRIDYRCAETQRPLGSETLEFLGYAPEGAGA